MADKEERIRGELRIQIKQFLWPDCKECGGKCKTAKAIKFCKDCQPGILKQEAIEVMAKAICKTEQYDMTGVCCDEICLKWKYFLPQAKAALNALLEGGNK